MACLLGAPGLALAQDGSSPRPVEPITVTATRLERPADRLPASIDVVPADRIRDGQLQVNLSEALSALAGVVANNRQNYAQDLQISIRGFGARSTFGVRGVRLIVDGIPATQPDGQGQVAHLDLASAERIEVLRGPFSVLYGNSSGGVIQVFTGEGPAEGEASASIAGGSDSTQRYGARLGGRGWLLSAGRFETAGYREHSAAVRTGANGRLKRELSAGTTLTLVGNALEMPEALDPLGLTRERFEADPVSADPAALLFNTRKSVEQQQAGLTLDHALGGGHAIRIGAYGGARNILQFQAIPVPAQANPLHPGGVIDLDRRHAGLEARWNWQGALAGRRAAIVAGGNGDFLDEDRRGYQNFADGMLGVRGALRRDEENRIAETGVFAQAEWQAHEAVALLAGVRASRVRLDSADRYVTAVNPDDSGRVSFRATTPVLGATWGIAPGLRAHIAAGRGFETPTVNELSYRPGGESGLNIDLRPARSDNFEAGAKWSDGEGLRATAAAFRVETRDEIVVATNSGGRATFRNAAATRRDGLELQLAKEWSTGLELTASFAILDATYRDGFLACAAAPCNAPNVAVPAGNRIPGIPRTTAHAELRWQALAGLELAAGARHLGPMKVNDLNTDESPSCTVLGARIGGTWRLGRIPARAFARVNNLFARRCAGSVIVNEASARYFEPAPGRTFLVGISADAPK
jgi:iron complex outermembrane receptor protein